MSQGNFNLFPPPSQQFAQTTLSSTTLLPNQPIGPPLFRDGKPEQASSSVSIASVFSSVASNTLPLSTTSGLSTKPAPVNVVITASDPLPTSKSATVQPILSVTIPPQHLKGNLPPKSQPHNYQIPLPVTSSVSVSAPSILTQTTLPVTTQSILSNVAPPVFSALPDKSPAKSTGLGLQIEKSLSQSFTSTLRSEEKSDLNNSSSSTNSADDNDPCPDFKPIIPLPNEVPVNTGEENEVVLFCCRAKLFRYVNGEWKERGLGDIKILHNPETNKVRILMRRDQVHKICANHFITKEMTLSPMPSNDRAFVWAANDFADQEVVFEKFCVKLKTPEEAKQFYDAFQNAIKLITQTPQKMSEPTTAITSKTTSKPFDIKASTVATTSSTAVFGGFVFTSAPTFKPKDEKVEITEVKTDTPKASPFADFSFGNAVSISSPFTPVQKQTSVNKETLKTVTSPVSGDDDHSVTEFEPAVEFKPVVPLPAIVDVKTGEENAEVLHECRAKLLRYDSATKEWKERGLGNMKILKEDKIIRLLMRREQVLKVCCNHQLLKNMSFSKMRNNPKALNWCAQDFSEEILKTETFALRFKTEEQATEFLNALHSAQALLNDNNTLEDKVSEKIQERNQHAKMKIETTEKPSDVTPKQSSWGERFKPKSGSWSCKTCYIVNEGKDNYCVACETPKNDNLPKKEASAASGPTFTITVPSFTSSPNSSVTQSQSPFKFGIPQSADKVQPTGFGDLFKPKEGSWSCKTCYVRNDTDKLYCVSCESPKDDTVPKKESNKGLNLTNSESSFTFGIPQTTNTSNTSNFSFGTKPAELSTGFVFGAATSTNKETPLNLASKPFNFTPPDQLGKDLEKNNESKTKEANADKFIFGSPQKHTFEFTPRSPRKSSGCHGEEESDGSFVEEEADNIYFKPVIPLPDKVEVKTGEEGEEVLYCHRAKLFRFVDGEWKERGIGDVKILFHPETKKLR